MILKLYSQNWRNEWNDLLAQTQKELTIVSPYIRYSEINKVIEKLSADVSITVITKLDLSSFLSDALEIKALTTLLNKRPKNSTIIDLPGLHAKIYVADKKRAIITSANLTKSGIDSNHEYGVGITDLGTINKICANIDNYRASWRCVSKDELERLAVRVSDRRKKRNAALKHLDADERQLGEYIKALRNTRQTRAKTRINRKELKERICRLLKKGPETTKNLQDKFKRQYPKFFDYEANIETNGVNNRKKWEHTFREAQQTLKRGGKVIHNKENKTWTLP